MILVKITGWKIIIDRFTHLRGVQTVVVAIFFVAVTIFGFSRCAWAADELPTHKVVFYEIMWAGSNEDRYDEWFVLKNNTATAIDLSGWRVDYLSGSGAAADDKLMFALASGEEIPANGYFLVSNALYPDVDSILRISSDFSTSIARVVNLRNEYLRIKLYNSGGNLIDVAGNGDVRTAFAGSNNAPKSSMVRVGMDGTMRDSWETNTARCNLKVGAGEWATPQSSNPTTLCHPPRIKALDDYDNITLAMSNTESLRFNISDAGNEKVYLQKDSENIIEQETGDFPFNFQCQNTGANQLKLSASDDNGYSEWSTNITCYQPADIIINEVMPSPHTDYGGDGKADTKDEWVELYNPGDEDIDLAGWYLQDAADTAKAKKRLLDGKSIAAKGFLVLFRDDTGVSLNDDGETISLFDPSDTLVSQLSWQDAENDVAWAYNGERYLWTTTPTPGALNIFTAAFSDVTAAANSTSEPADTTGHQPQEVSYVLTTTVTHLDYGELLDIELPSFDYETARQVLTPYSYSDTPVGIDLSRNANFNWREPFLLMIMLLSLAGLSRKMLSLWL